MGRRLFVPLVESKSTLRRTQSQPAPEKPEFEVKVDLERFTGKVVAGLSEAMDAQRTQQEKPALIKELVRRIDDARCERSSTISGPPLTEAEIEQATAELAAAARIVRETATAHAEGREPSPEPSVISISGTETSAIVRLPPAEETMPDVGTQIDPPRPQPSSRSNNQERQDGSWMPINAPIEARAMREDLVNWDSRAMSCVDNGNLTLSEATQPPSTNPGAVAEIPEFSRRIASQQAQTERLRARGADLASMAGATAFDHTGALTVFTSFSPRQNRMKRASEWTIHENVDISLPDKYRWDVTDLEAEEGGVEQNEVELPIGKSEGYRTIYSYFQPVIRHRQGVLPERVRFEMTNGYLHVDGMQVPHLPGFEYGVGYANEETSQLMIKERERTPRQVARPIRNRSASQFGQFALQVTADARERLRDPRNRIPRRFYCEEEDCGQSHNLESNRRFHRRDRHRPVETHRCEECPKSFRQENQLERHSRIHERRRREALVGAMLSHEGAHPQETSEGAVPGTARSSAETLHTLEALAGFHELPLRLDDTEDAQPQDSKPNDNAEEERTGTTPIGSDPPASDDDDDNVGLRGGYLEGPRPLYRMISYLEASGGGVPTEAPPEAFATSQQCRPSPGATLQLPTEKDSRPQIGTFVILQIFDDLTEMCHCIGKYREKLKVCSKEVVAAENTVCGCLLLADMDMVYGLERQTNHIGGTKSRKVIDYVERAMPFKKKTDGDAKLCGKLWSKARKLKQKCTGAFPLRTGGGSEASGLRGGEGDSHSTSGRRPRPSTHGTDPQSLAMVTSNAGDTGPRTSSVGRTCGSQHPSQNYSTANSSMSESTGASRKKERSNSRRAKAGEYRKGSRKREREEDPEENDRQYLESQKKRKLQSESEAQDASQAARDGVSGDVDEDASVTQSEGKADDNRHSCARQRASNSQDTRPGGRSRPLWHSRNQDASATQQSSHMTGEVFGEGVSMQESYESTTLLRHPRSSDAASTEAAEKQAAVKIRNIALLIVLDDLSVVRGHLRAFGELLHLFIAKGLAANEVGPRLEKANQKLLYVLLGLTKDAVLAEAQEKLDEAVKPGETETAEEAEACAKILNLNRRLKLELEGARRRRHSFTNKDSGLHGGAGVSAVPAEENPPSQGRTVALRKTLNDLNGLRRDIRASTESLDAFTAKFGMVRTRVRANLDLAAKEILYMLLRLTREELLTQAQETIGRIFEAVNYGKTQIAENAEACAKILSLARWARIESEGRSRKRYGNVSKESGLRGGASAYDSRLDVPTAAAFQLRMRDDYTPSWQCVHEPMAIDRRPLNTCRPRKGAEGYPEKVSELRGGHIADSEAQQQLAKAAAQYTADGSNHLMIENNACQYDCGSNFCSTHQMHHNSNNSTFKSNSLNHPTVGSRLRNEAPTAQPLSHSPHAHQTYTIPPGRALLFGQTTSQPRDPSMAWQSNMFSATNGAVGLIGHTDMCYYSDPVNSRFCTTHHIIHGRLRRPPPSSSIAPYAPDETTLMAQARTLTLGSPYALDETSMTAQARALTLGFVSNGVPDVAMLQHQAKVHASQAFDQNPQWTHEMQPSARSHLWAAQGGAYFGRGLQQTPASSRVASWSQNVAQKVEDEWGEASFTSSIGAMSDRTLVPGTEAGHWELQSSHCNKPAAMPSNTRKRQRTSAVEEDEGHRANASAPNQNARKRTKRETSAGLEQSQQLSTFVETPSSFGNQHDDWEMVDAPLVFNRILENERRLMEGKTDAQDCATGMSFGDGTGTLRGGSLEDGAHDAHTHGSPTLPLRTAQQPTRQFTSCIGQVESRHSRIPGPVSPPNPLGQIPSSAAQVATTGLDGTNDDNQNLFVGGEIAEAEEGTQLNTDGFNVSFEVPPLTPDYPSAHRNATWHAAAVRRMEEVLSTREGREFVRRSRNGQPPSVLGRRQRSTSSSVSPLSRPAPATRDDSFASVASAQVQRHTLNPSARTFLPFQQLANPLRQPFNPPHHALLDHPFIRSANGAVEFQVPFNTPNPLRPPLQPRELSSPQIYPVLTPRASTPPPRQRIAWDGEDFFRGFQSDMEDPNFGRRVRVSRRGQEVHRAVTPPPRRRILWDDESDDRGSLNDLENPADFARRARGFRRRQEVLRRSRARRRNGLPMFADLSRLARPEMSGGLAFIEDDIWERNQRLACEAEAAPLYLRSFVDALPTGTVGGAHGDRSAYIDSLLRSTAASGHGAGERGGVPEGVWYNITFERRLDSKPAPKRRRLNTRSNNHRHVLDSENDFSGAESDEDEEYVVFSWDVQLPAAGMKDLLRSTGPDWGVKATRARDWALEEMAREPKGEDCTEAIGEWWEAVRGGASRDERCKVVGVRVLEP